MPQITLLDKNTIDKIAAGEVVDRPASVVKELVENAVDAKATAVTVEIKEGGISFIRITDNGCGIEKEQVPLAFCRHSTSKIRTAEDLVTVSSLGFRGEALSSIAAVSQVELITKTPEQLTGYRYVIEGGQEQQGEDVGAPNGTTFLVRNLFYNTPARRKFLKTAATEGGYISDLMERLALSNPDISFKFINNGQVRLHTSGNSNLKDIIYHIYGRNITANLLEISRDFGSFSVKGFVGRPVISRGNRNFENYFVNGRYIKSSLLAKTIEDAYKGFMMQHKYPFTVLLLSLNGDLVDVNVHPAKMELRFSNGEVIYQKLSEEIRGVLRGKELIPEVSVKEEKESREKEPEKKVIKNEIPEPFELHRLEKIREAVAKDSPYEKKYDRTPGVSRGTASPGKEESLKQLTEPRMPSREEVSPKSIYSSVFEEKEKDMVKEPSRQMELSDLEGAGNKLLDKKAVPYHKIIGQLFDTYWLVEFKDQLYMIDQHAAHEKVLYERTMASYRKKEFTSQYVSPPILLSLTMQEEVLLKKYMSYFKQLGFEIEPFGGKEYAIRAVPDNLYGLNGQELVLEIMDSLGTISDKDAPDIVMEKVASMSCKAAVKGNQKLSRPEIESLIGELLTLDNPYHCPHGRPVIVSMSKYEIEKKFKRII